MRALAWFCRLALLPLTCALLCASSAGAASWTAVFSQEAHFGSTDPSGASLGVLDLGASPLTGSSPFSVPDPFDVAITPDARTAYTASFGTCGASSGNLVQPVDLSVSPPVAMAPIALGAIGAFGVAVSPDGRTVYASGCGKVVPIDVSVSPATLGTPIDVPADPFSLAISRDGRTLWTANHSTGNVSVIDLAAPTPSVVKTIAVGTQPLGLSLTPDGTRLYVANGASCTISVIDTATETASASPIALPPAACSSSPQGYFGDPGRVVMSPDGATLYAASLDQQVVTPISTATNTAGTPISFTGVSTPSGQPFKPGGLTMTPDGARLLVADAHEGPSFGNTVQVVATPANTLSGPPISLNSSLGFGIDAAVTPDQAPVADFAVATQPPGSPTRFDASTSTVRYGTIATYAWDFGDGSPAQTTTGPTIEHTYDRAGTYSATVTETDATGTSLPATSLMTGRTFVRHGSDSARTSRSVVVSAGASPAVGLSSSSLGFGPLGVGRTSDPKTLTLTNAGNGPLTISGSAITGAQASDYKLGADGCTGHTVAAGVACTVAVTFHPQAGGARGARLAFTDDASGSPHTVALTGEGQTTATISGTVSDGSKAGLPAVAGAKVSICTYSTRAVCRSDTTDASGHYAETGLPAATYQIEVLPTATGLFAGSSVVQAGVGTTVANFRLQAPQSFPSGVSFNGQAGGVGTSFWTSASVLQAPVALPAGQAPGTTGKTVVNFWVDPQGGSPIGGTSGQMVVAYRYDNGGTPLLTSVTAQTSGTIKKSSPAVGAWTTSMAPAVALGADVSSFTAQGQLTPPANGPYFHGAQAFLVNYYSTLSATGARAAAAAPPGPCDPPLSKDDDGKVTLPGGMTWDPKSLTVHRADGSEMFVFSSDGPPPTGPNGEQIAGLAPDGTPIPFNGTEVSTDPQVIDSGADSQIHVPNSGSPNDEVWVDTSPGPSEGRYGFSPDGSFVDLNTGIKYGPDGNPQGKTNQGRPDDPCKPDQPIPPPTPRKPPGGSGSGGTSGSNYVDPSGSVMTKGKVPVAGAKVVLTRSDTAKGRFRAVPNGSSIMAPGNRRNPDHTTALGLFAWDVVPGFYRVSAQHAGCRATVRTKVLTIPPAVLGLRLSLDCPHLRRTATRTALVARKVGKAQVAVTARVRGAHGHRPEGIVRFSAGRRHLGDVPVDPHTGRATMTAAGRGAKGITARYQGDGVNAPSSSSA